MAIDLWHDSGLKFYWERAYSSPTKSCGDKNMPKPYSIDLRQRVLQYLEETRACRQLSHMTEAAR